jgi:hypothetical protein
MIIFAALGALLVAIAAMAVVGTGGRAVPSAVPVSPSPLRELILVGVGTDGQSRTPSPTGDGLAPGRGGTRLPP